MLISKKLSLARAISEIGNSFRFVALPLAVLGVRNKASDLVTAEILETLGYFISGLFAAFFIDRVSKLKALVIADISSLVVTAILFLGIYKQSLPILFAGSFLMTLIETFYINSLSASTADILDNEANGNKESAQIRGFTKLQIYNFLGGILGSLGASEFIKHSHLQNLMIIDGITFLVSSIWVLNIFRQKRVINKTPTQPKVSSLNAYLDIHLMEWKEGFKYSYSNPKIFVHIVFQSIVGVAHGLLSACSIAHQKNSLGSTNAMVGYSQTSNRVWTLLGSIFRLRTKQDTYKLIIFSAILMGIGYFGMASTPWIGFVAFYGLQQFGNAILAPTNRAIAMNESDSTFRGRVATFRNLMIDFGVLAGNLLSLLIVAHFSTVLGLQAAGFAIFVAIIFLKLTLKKYNL